FADYHDPAHMGFRALRVINEDRIKGGKGFPTHPHRDMEILTYILEGELAHRDSMNNGRVIKRGEVQGMSAGTGITHSEFNASRDAPCHLLQIWMLPHMKNVTPSYAEWKPDGSEKKGWALVASEGGKAGGVPIHQDASVYVAVAEAGRSLGIPVAAGRYGWLQVAKGEAEIGGKRLEAGDGVSFFSGDAASVKMHNPGELLLFDLA
ncbi:MAG: pirin family protein, partial [Pseudomonadota bacterium]|nr:pirin family protein [Pseudomonadota bacterium]